MALVAAAGLVAGCGSGTEPVAAGDGAEDRLVVERDFEAPVPRPSTTEASPALDATVPAGPGLGNDRLDCTSDLISGLVNAEAPPEPGQVRSATEVIVEALRYKGVVEPAVAHLEALGDDLPVPTQAGAEHVLGARLAGDRALTIHSVADPVRGGHLAGIVVSRDDRAVVVVRVTEHERGYWMLEGAAACSEEVRVEELVE